MADSEIARADRIAAPRSDRGGRVERGSQA